MQSEYELPGNDLLLSFYHVIYIEISAMTQSFSLCRCFSFRFLPLLCANALLLSHISFYTASALLKWLSSAFDSLLLSHVYFPLPCSSLLPLDSCGDIRVPHQFILPKVIKRPLYCLLSREISFQIHFHTLSRTLDYVSYSLFLSID